MLQKGLLEQRLAESEVFPPKSADFLFEHPLKRVTPYTLGKFIGSYYEALSQALFGGISGESDGKPVTFPDIKDTERGRYIEVKAASHTRRIMLKDEQILHHKQLQISDEPIDNPRLYVNLFRYGVRGMCAGFGKCKPRKLVDFLASNTRFLVGLDFCIVHRCYSLGFQNHKLLSRRYGKGIPATHFSSTILDLFFAQPEEALKSVGLLPGDYRILFRKSAQDFRVNGFLIKQFPIVLIKSSDKEHQRFIEELRKS